MDRPRPWEPRFWAKVGKSAGPDGCWLWTAHLNETGYGGFQTRDPGFETRFAHRLSWLLEHGSIDPELTIDHLCRVRHCVNPKHMEQVPIGINARRGVQHGWTHCSRGHPFTEENTLVQYRLTYMKRRCRTCARLAAEKFYAKHGGQAAYDRELRRRHRVTSLDGSA